jgi:hypothetical protein
MIPLSEVDIQRVKDVREGKVNLWERGCGKTTERMITLFSYLRPQNDGNQYLFIGENNWHTRDICRTFYYWIKESGIGCEVLHSKMSLIAKFDPQTPGNSFMDRLLYFLEEPVQPAKIRFDFTTPERLYPWGIRGRRYDKILIDLTDDIHYRYWQTIEEAMWTEKSKWQ